MMKKIITGLSAAAALVAFGISIVRSGQPVPIYINEVMSSNGGTLMDEDGEYTDWIELYYAGEEPLSLEGYFLSDQKENPDRWKFPDVVMEPDSYLVVYASGKDRIEPETALHTNFKISSAGEAIYLSDADGRLIAEAEVPKAVFDKSYGQAGVSGQYAVLAEATPGECNVSEKAPLLKKTSEISFSVPAGYYAEQVYLELDTKEKGAEIYYTLDGSIPDQTCCCYDGEEIVLTERTGEENRYTDIWCTPVDFAKGEDYMYDPKPQYKATVVKARMYFPEEDCWSEDIFCNTYLIGADYTMPIVSLSMPEELLFDEEDGIYVPGAAYEHYINFTEERDADVRFWKGNYWYDQKIPGYLEYFENGARVMENEVTLRICGAGSRGNAQKAFAVYAQDNEKKKDSFSYPVFGEDYLNIQDETIDSFTSLRLRAFGNDNRRSMFRDALSQELVADLNLGTQGYQPCILLINGEYFGVYEIRENRDAKFFEEHFGIAQNNLVKTEVFALSEDHADQYEQEFLDLIKFVEKNDQYLQVNYEKVKEQLDVEQFIDYVLTEQYLHNIDWPQNNVVAFRSRKTKENSVYEDGRWRFVMYDLDYAINYETENNFETIQNSDSFVAVLLRALLDNEEFCTAYTERFEELLETNFNPAEAIRIQKQFEEEFAPEIEETLKRWNVYNPDGTPLKKITPDYWYEKMEDLRKFFEERPEYAREYFYMSIQ